MTEVSDILQPENESRFEQELSASFSNASLHLILLPTERCNFRCTYCYEDFSVGRMDSATIGGVKRFIDRRLDSLDALSISWFGGEPLLARSVVEDISQHVVQGTSIRKHLQYQADMTTNGYLLDLETAEQLVRLGITLFQISLDGPEALHNRTRVQANGAGSFRQIFRNLLAIRNGTTPLSILLRVHLTPDNLPFMRDFLIEIRDTFLHDTRFSVLLKPVERLGGPNDDALNIIPEKSRPQILAELGSLLHDGLNREPLFGAPTVCYAARPNSILIRANGLVGKCTVALTNPENIVGRLLPDGLLQIDNTRLRPWLRGWQTRDWELLECPYASFRQKRSSLVQLSGEPASVF